MIESDLDNAIAQAEQFLVLAKELKRGFHQQDAAISKTREQAIANGLSDKEVQAIVSSARYQHDVSGTRIMGAVKHACVTLSFFLAKLRK